MKRQVVMSICLLFGVFALALGAEKQMRPEQAQVTASMQDRLLEWSRSHNGEPIPVAVTFRKHVSDEEVLTLLAAYGAQPYAIFLHYGDLYGVHRVDNAKATLSIVGEARQRTIEMQIAALRGIQERSKALVEGKNQRDFMSNPEEIDKGRSLIGRSKVAASLKQRGEEGESLIYGIQALIDTLQVGRLQEDPYVLKVEPAALTLTQAGLRWIAPDPEPVVRSLVDEMREVNEMNPADLYRELQRFAAPRNNQEVFREQ